MRVPGVLLFALSALASAALAATPPKLPSPNAVHTFYGAVNLHTEGNSVIVALSHNSERSLDTIFHVDARDAAGLPLVLRSESAEVIQWNGHLVVLAPDQERALHLSAPGFPAKVRLSLDGGTSTERLDPAALDARLEASYQLTTLDSAVEIGSRSGALPAIQLDDEKAQVKWLSQERNRLRRQVSPINTTPYNPDLGDGSGNGGSSCSQTCPNGAS